MTRDLRLTPAELENARRLVEAGLQEELLGGGDCTSEALFDANVRGTAVLVARQNGVVAGLPVAEMVFRKLDDTIRWTAPVNDGTQVRPGDPLAVVQGKLRSLLAGERSALNFLAHLSGIATLSRKYVDAVAGTGAAIYDTRKTFPGARLLQKYAVRAGGGNNHRLSLGDAVLIKDNHLAAIAAMQSPPPQDKTNPEETLLWVIQRIRERAPEHLPLIVEVDTIDQLRTVLGQLPQIVLLDNMDPRLLQEAVRLRDQLSPAVLLEASGGITLQNVAAVAAAGVNRISIGALTHSAPALDVAMDWSGR